MMNQNPQPEWTKEQKEAGERITQAWGEFFSEIETEGESHESPFLDMKTSKIAEIRTLHEAALLRYPNVVAVDVGIRTKQGKPTGERCLVVYVERKIPQDDLEKSAVLPSEIEGIPVDVVEVGRVEAL